MTNKSRLVSGRVPVSNSANVTSDRYQFLDLGSAEPNLGTANVGEVLVYDTSSPGSRKWIPQSNVTNSSFTQANIATVLAQAAYNQANVTIGVDTSQNARMTIIEGTNLSQNTRIDYSNTAITIIQGTNTSQNVRLDYSNTRMTVSDGVDASQNVRLDYSNTRMTVSDGVNASQNTRLDYSNTAITIIQGTDVTQNTRLTVIEGTDVTQNTAIASTDGKMQSAYNKANTGGLFSGDVTITGNLVVNGVTTSVNTSTITTTDSLIKLANNNTAGDSVDIGFYGTYNSSGQKYAGLVRQAGSNFFLFKDITTDPTGNTLPPGSLTGANTGILNANVTGYITSNGYNLYDYTTTLYSLANTHSNQIVVIQGTDVTQNTRLTVIEGTDVSQNTRMTIADGVDASQNTRLDYSNTAITIIQGVDVTQNTNIASTDGKMQSAYNQANTGTVLAQAGYNQANASFLGVNTAIGIIQNTDLSQNTRIDYSNTAITIIQGVDLTQNTSIAATDGKMQNAYAQANTGTVLAQAGYNQANASFLAVNNAITIIQGTDVTQNAATAATNQYATSAFSTANNAYIKANNALANTTGTFAGTLTVTGNVIANSFQTTGSSGNISGANFVYANTFVSSNAYIFSDGTVQTTGAVSAAFSISSYNQANTGTVLAQAAYNQANVTIGVDATQNTRLTIIEGTDVSQNTRIDYSNTAITIIQGVDVTQNTNIAATDGKMQSAYGQANTGTVLAQASYNQSNASFLGVNTAITIIQGVDLTQNTAIAATDGKMQLAYGQANTGTVLAQAAYNQANVTIGVDATQNTRLTVIEGTDVTQNTNIAATDGKMQSAYNQANTGTVLAQAAYIQANVTIGVDATQNTRLTVLEGTDVSQNTRIDYSNAAITIIQGVDVTQNTNIAATDGKMQSAYNQANTGTVLAQASYNQANVTIGVDATQNTRLTVIEGTDVSQNARMAIIEATNVSQNVRLDYSNSAITILQGVDAGQNTLIQTVYNTANVGRNFVTQGGTVSGNVSILGNLNVSGNISVIGNVTNLVITGNSGQFFGNNTTGFEALYAGIAVGYDFQPQTVLQTSGNFNGYSQINNQNINPGANASSDIVATADNGNESDTFIDMGINSSNYSQAEFSLTGPNDGYLYVHGNTSTGGGNLIFSTMHQNDIIFSINGATTANEIARFKSNGGLILKNYPLTFTDGTKQNTAASPVNYTQSSFDKANSASSNTIVTQGVDLTQNTAIAATDGKMQSAYNQANVTIGVDATQNTRLTVIENTDLSQNVRIDYSNTAITIIQGTDVSQNSRMVIIEGTDVSQNARMVIIEATDVSQNARMVIADGVDASQNVRIDYSNTAITIIQGVDLGQNTAIAATDGKMQSAYNQANTGTVLAQAAYNQANVTIGVDATQNTRLTVIENTDLSQNSRIDYSNAAITIIQGTDVSQNSRMVIIEGVDVWQNNSIIALQSSLITINSNSAYSSAIDNSQNSRMTIIEGTDLSQNVSIAAQNSFITIIQGTDTSQNARMTIIENTDVSQNVRLDWSNTSIAATDGKMQSAYNQANTAQVKAQAAFDAANTAGAGVSIDSYARQTANAAYSQANTDFTNVSIISVTSSSNGLYIPVITVAANGRVTAISNTLITGGGSSAGYLANSVIFANTTGYLSNTSNISFYTSNNTLIINGTLAATSKSFSIPHPTKPNTQLRYGSLEGPENGVYVRGRLFNSNIIELPEYWTKLIDPNTITVNLTPVGNHQKLFVEKIENNCVYVGQEGWFKNDINCFYVVYAERSDIEKLVVES